MKRFVLALLFLITGALAAYAGGPDEPIGDGKLGRVRLGWDGHAPGAGLVPVSLLLENPDPKTHVLSVVVGAGDERREETVELAPGAKRRLTFVLPTRPRKVQVALSENGTPLASSEHDLALLPLSSILLVDGDPGSRQVAEIVSGTSVFACGLEDLPSELGAITPFEAIVLRHANPARAGEGARAVLDDYVRAGGTLIVAPNAADPETRTFWEEIPKTPTTIEPDLMEKRHGLGRVLLAPSDPCAATPDGLLLRSVLSAELDLTPRRLFPRFLVAETQNEAAHRAGKLLGVFFVLYLVVTGPFLAWRWRGQKPRKTLRAVAVILAGFTAFAFVIARQVRSQPSRVTALTVTIVPGQGDAVALTEVVVASGGGREERVTIEGEDVSATAAERHSQYTDYDQRISRSMLWTPASVKTRRALGVHPVTFDALKVPTLGDVRIHSLARSSARPLEASVEIDPITGALTARVHNTSGHDLSRVAVYGPAAHSGLAVARFDEGIRAGETAVAPVTTRGAISPWRVVRYPSAMGYGGPNAHEELAPRDPSRGGEARWILLAEDALTVRVSSGGSVAERAWRIEAVASVASLVPGSLAITVKPATQGVRVVTSNRQTSERIVRGYYPSPGSTILAVGGRRVKSQEDLDRAFAEVPPWGSVEIVTTDGRWIVEIEPRPVRKPLAPGAPQGSVVVDDEGD